MTACHRDPEQSDPVDVGQLRAALDAAARWYRGQLLHHDTAARRLLHQRGLAELATDSPTGHRWDAGYTPTARTGDPTCAHLRRHGYPDAVLLAAGIATTTATGQLIDALRHRLVLPLRDEHGVIAFTGRRLTPTPTVPKWRNTASTALYRKTTHLYGLAEQPDRRTAPTARVVLVEGALDAIAVHLAGDLGLATCGTALSDPHLEQLTPLTRPDRPLHLAYDNDPAGIAATLRAATHLAGQPALHVLLPAGTDPADLFTAHGATGLHRALSHTRPLAETLLLHQLARWDRHLEAGNAAARVEAVRELAPLINGAAPGQHAALITLLAAGTGLPAHQVTVLVLDTLSGD